MRVMTASGYKWDENKKELMKIEQKSKGTEEDEQYLLVCKNALRKYQVSDKWDADIISKWLENKLEQGERKPMWSENDEHHWMICLECVEDCATQQRTDFSKTIDWLKSIRQRMEE
jgi:hypothetical protein